jgi:hypothetical protein
MEEELIIVSDFWLLIIGIGFIIFIVTLFILIILHSSGSFIKVGDVIRKFDNCENMKINPYEKNYKDCEVIEIKESFALIKDLETGKIESTTLESVAMYPKIN